MSTHSTQFETGDLLLVIDVQKDFCPGGALPISEGDQVVAPIKNWMNSAHEAGIPIYFSRDWHPRNHLSFKEYGGLWPAHCLQDTDGARFHEDLEISHDIVIVTKGTRFDQDQNSAFDQTGLADWLHRLEIRRIFVAGLAQDVCVLATVLDGCKAGFEMHLIEDATRPVTADGGANALEQMRHAGAKLI